MLLYPPLSLELIHFLSFLMARLILTFESDFSVLVPQSLRVYFTSVDRTQECCPGTPQKGKETGYCRIEDGSGSAVEFASVTGGKSIYLEAVAYDFSGMLTRPRPVVWRSTGSLFPPVRTSYVFTPLAEGEGTISISDADGHAASTMITVTCEPLFLPSDLNQDGNVDILDIFIVAKAFGTKPGGPNWNAIADVNRDGHVDILDIFAVAKDLGKRPTNPCLSQTD